MTQPIFHPKLWSDAIVQQMQQQSAIAAAMAAPFRTTPWEVWFAWFPVRIRIVTNVVEIHDEVTIESYTRWRWLICVARRPYRKFVFIQKHRRYPFTQPYEYGPATNALIQPNLRGFWHGK